ncbi:trypsin-like serine peptidase [Aureimonas leprariae]|uniref:trypsin-like serine peptidase n=1 Tax=Plantimonas leprariae TaxID=2615207 RepID=UPI0013868104|nr:trypsin-like peptidase domain-containing protein [Aureimonas leprariae]
MPILATGIVAGAYAQPATERLRVDVTTRPWTAVGQVNNGSYGRCTGVLVAPQAAITAAHCLFNKSTGRFVQPASVHFVLGYDRGTYAFQSTVRAVRMAKDYEPTGQTASAANDWAWLELADPAPARFAPVSIATSDLKRGDVVASAGYGRDRAYALTAVASCRYLATTAAGLLMTECPITFGYSGGPLLDGEGRLVGIQVAGGRLGGKDVALAVPPSAWIEAEDGRQ